MIVKAFYRLFPECLNNAREIFGRFDGKTDRFTGDRMDETEGLSVKCKLADFLEKLSKQLASSAGHVGQTFVTTSISRISEHGMTGVFQMGAYLMRATGAKFKRKKGRIAKRLLDMERSYRGLAALPDDGETLAVSRMTSQCGIYPAVWFLESPPDQREVSPLHFSGRELIG